MLYKPSVDLVNSNVYTKFGLKLFVHSQDIEQKPYSDINQVKYSVANFQKTNIYNPSLDFVNDNVYTLFSGNQGP